MSERPDDLEPLPDDAEFPDSEEDEEDMDDLPLGSDEDAIPLDDDEDEARPL